MKSNKVQTSGYILKDSLEYNRIIANWQEKNPNFKEHTQAKGLHWYVDRDTQRKKMEWWL